MKLTDFSNAGFGTRAIHGGQHPDTTHGALATPIYQTSTFCFDTVEDGIAKFSKEKAGYVYSRGGNPTTSVLQDKIALLEKGEACFITSSGMGAIGSVLLALLKPGDHVVCGECVYGCTHVILRDVLKKFGIETSFVDTSCLETLEKSLQSNTRVIVFESPTNPTMKLTDIKAVSALAKSKNIKVVVDNTFAPPPLQFPLELGADIVVHSTTKYLNGHGDVIGGAIVGRKQEVDEIAGSIATKICGCTSSPFNSFLTIRGLQTLELRMERHCANGMALARHLAAHSAVASVNYPGLPAHPQHELAARQMNGLFGGMLSFELKDGLYGLSSFEACKKLLNKLKIASIAVSLGDPATLVQHPASMTHNNVPVDYRKAAGIADGLVRLSLGLENARDLVADFDQALDSLNK